MCGFVALIRKNKRQIDPVSIRLMNQEILHRGPDDEGYFENEWLGLGFRRLAIIDLSEQGHQPMLDASGRYVCVFNGEIYNYRELRKSLENEGVIFRGHSDTEVLLNAYIHWGEQCLEKFIGMFAFIIADLKMQSVFVARDFPGIKPLYFTEDDHFYYFASEIKAFRKVLSLSVNPDCYSEQFNYRYLAGDRTLFNNVTKVLPGHCWKIHKGTLEKKAYFDLSSTFNAHRSSSRFLDIVEETKNYLHESFLLHTRSDVGYCVQLSGGVDSSYLTSVLAGSQPTLNTFSIQSEIAEVDETPYQQQVIERYHTHHQAFTMTGAHYADQLERATYHLEAPIMHSGSVFLMELCRHIRDTSKVVLTGEGADELFGGYWRHKPSRQQQLIFNLQKQGFRGKWLPSVSKIRTLKALLNENQIAASHRYQVSGDFHRFFSCDSVPSSRRLEYAKTAENNYLSAILSYDQQTYMASVLDRQDKLSMSYSVEARVPYCHQDLYRKLNPIASSIKLYGGERKAILKQCTQELLPRDLVYRRKNGLRLPIADWYRDEKLVGRYLGLLTDQTAKQRGIYHIPAIEKAVDAFRRGDNRYEKPITMLVNLELWHRVYNI